MNIHDLIKGTLNNIMYPFLVITSTLCHVLTLFVSLREPFCIVMPTEYSYMTSSKECLNREFTGDLMCPKDNYPLLDQQLIQATHVKIGFYTIRCESTKVCCTHDLIGRLKNSIHYISSPLRNVAHQIDHSCSAYLQSLRTPKPYTK